MNQDCMLNVKEMHKGNVRERQGERGERMCVFSVGLTFKTVTCFKLQLNVVLLILMHRKYLYVILLYLFNQLVLLLHILLRLPHRYLLFVEVHSQA